MPTVERQVTLLNNLGLHVRPAARLAAIAMQFRSDVRIGRDGEAGANAKSGLDLLTLSALYGTVLTVRATGEDAEAAVEAVVREVQAKFGEE